MMDQKEIAEKLALLANTAEELQALLSDEHPTQALHYQAVATRARANATCLRIHGTLPVLRVHPITEAIKAAKQFERGISSVSRLFDKKG